MEREGEREKRERKGGREEIGNGEGREREVGRD